MNCSLLRGRFLNKPSPVYFSQPSEEFVYGGALEEMALGVFFFYFELRWWQGKVTDNSS